MSETDDQGTSGDGDLAPMPEPTAEEPELAAGGTDAVGVEDSEERADSEPRDLDPERNPGVDDAMPDEISQGEDKKQAPAEGSDDEAGGGATGGASGQPEESRKSSGEGGDTSGDSEQKPGTGGDQSDDERADEEGADDVEDEDDSDDSDESEPSA